MASVLAAIVLAAIVLPGPAAASPWTRPPGEPLAIMRAGYQEAESEDRRFEQWTAQSYMEIGLSDRLMLGATLAHAWQGTEGPPPLPGTGGRAEDALSGLAEASGFLQYALRRGETGVLAVAVSGSAPTGTVSRFIEDRRFERDAALGAAFLYGNSRGPIFFAARLGPEFSLGEDADLLEGELTLGLKRGRALFLMQSFTTTALGGAGPAGLDYDLYQLSPSLVFRATERIGLQFGASVDVAGRGLDLGRGAFLSVWIEG